MHMISALSSLSIRALGRCMVDSCDLRTEVRSFGIDRVKNCFTFLQRRGDSHRMNNGTRHSALCLSICDLIPTAALRCEGELCVYRIRNHGRCEIRLRRHAWTPSGWA